MPKVILPTPPSTYFFPGSARFPPGFRRIPPGSAGFLCRVPAGFRWVPPLRRGFARFRWVPGFLRSVPPGFAGFAPRGSCSRPPFKLLLRLFRLCQVLARFLPGVCQGCGSQRSVFCKCPRIVQVSLWKKITIRWLPWWSSRSFLLGPHAEGDAILIFIVHIEKCQHVPTFIDFCIEHICH